MEVLKGDHIAHLPFRDLKKVSDLIYYEGPILSHFRDKYGKDILFYWVDYSNEYNRWVVLQVTEKQLFSYLLKVCSLKDLFNKPFNDIIYSVEIGNTLEYSNVVQIFKEDVPLEYMPENDSFFGLDMPNIYSVNIDKYKKDDVIESFMSNAMFLKAAPIESKNRGLVNIFDAAYFLIKIGESFEKKIEHDVEKEFIKRGITDNKRIRKASQNVSEVFQLNVAKAEAASFAVALSPNPFIDTDEDFLNKKFLTEMFNSFKNDVIDIDKKTDIEVDKIIKGYKENKATDIYKPIVDLYNNKNFFICVTDKSFKVERTIKPIKIETQAKLIYIVDKAEPEKEFDTLAYVKKTASGKVSKKAPTLFDENFKKVVWPTDQIVLEDRSYKLKRILNCSYFKEGGLHIIENEFLGLEVAGETYTEAVSAFYKEFDLLRQRVYDLSNINPEDADKLEFMRLFVDPPIPPGFPFTLIKGG